LTSLLLSVIFAKLIMKERINEDEPYREWEELRPTRTRLTKFRDEFSGKTNAKPVVRNQRSVRYVAKKTLLDRPDSSALALIRESNFPLGLLSNQSISLLESNFRRSVQAAELTIEDLHRWLNGEEGVNQQEVIKKLRGTLFEEAITREFVKRNPNHFVTNPVLTSKIIGSMISRGSPGEFVMPDHLVFLKQLRVASLVGFIEDKKVVRYIADSELLEQLESERRLFSLIADNAEAQAQFRRETQKNIPSFPYQISVAPIHEGIVWLAVVREAVRDVGQLPNRTTLFESTVSAAAINQLSESLITKRFLPRLFPSLVKSADGS